MQIVNVGLREGLLKTYRRKGCRGFTNRNPSFSTRSTRSNWSPRTISTGPWNAQFHRATGIVSKRENKPQEQIENEYWASWDVLMTLGTDGVAIELDQDYQRKLLFGSSEPSLLP